MTLPTFRRRMIDSLPLGLRWRYSKHVEKAFDACFSEFDASEPVEKLCGRLEQKYGFPWMLLVSVLIEIIRYYIEHRTWEQREAFRGWQREMKAINERA